MDGAYSTSPMTTSAGGELGEGDLDCSVEDSTEVRGIDEFMLCLPFGTGWITLF